MNRSSVNVLPADQAHAEEILSWLPTRSSDIAPLGTYIDASRGKSDSLPSWAIAGKAFYATHGVTLCGRTEPRKEKQMLLRHKSWTSIHQEWATCQVLGQGTYGVVYRGEKRAPRGNDDSCALEAALKRCRLDSVVDYGIPETAIREVALLAELRDDENIVGVQTVSCNPERLYIVFELLDMDLKEHAKTLKDRQVSKDAVKHIARRVLRALGTMHRRKILHRDLKPHNILVSKDLSDIRIADLGLARHACSPMKALTHEVITLWYRPPELLLGSNAYGYDVDIWSVGCILGEILRGGPLFAGDSEIDTLFKIFRFFGTPTPTECPYVSVPESALFPRFPKNPDPLEIVCRGDEVMKDFLSQMLRLNPADRKSAWECLKHPWLASTSYGTKVSSSKVANQLLRNKKITSSMISGMIVSRNISQVSDLMSTTTQCSSDSNPPERTNKQWKM